MCVYVSVPLEILLAQQLSDYNMNLHVDTSNHMSVVISESEVTWVIGGSVGVGTVAGTGSIGTGGVVIVGVMEGVVPGGVVARIPTSGSVEVADDGSVVGAGLVVGVIVVGVVSSVVEAGVIVVGVGISELTMVVIIDSGVVGSGDIVSVCVPIVVMLDSVVGNGVVEVVVGAGVVGVVAVVVVSSM